MKRCFFITACAVAALVASTTIRAAAPRDSLLVSTQWLADHLHDPNLVLLHVGDEAEYKASHITGAAFADFHGLHTMSQDPAALTMEMPPADELRKALAAMGISDDSHVVLYYGKDWVSPATRIMFTMLYAGLKEVSLLDGGMAAWTKEGRAVTDAAPPAREGKLSSLKIQPMVVDAEFVKSHATMPGFAVVDGRDRAFYDGVKEGGPRDHRKAGHIPGAHSVPFSEITTDDLKVKSPSELEALFSAAGVKGGDTVIGYCHIGQQATAMLFGARTLGHPILLYDGSFEDWARRDLPVENPAKK